MYICCVFSPLRMNSKGRCAFLTLGMDRNMEHRIRCKITPVKTGRRQQRAENQGGKLMVALVFSFQGCGVKGWVPCLSDCLHRGGRGGLRVKARAAARNCMSCIRNMSTNSS